MQQIRGRDAGARRIRHAGRPAHTDDAAALIADAREPIIALVHERMTVSARIQQARITSGGRRVNLSREMEILASSHSSSQVAGVRHGDCRMTGPRRPGSRPAVQDSCVP